MRPQTLDDVIGQDHIVGKGRLLRRAIQADRLSSVIFYGPPGTGKTSLARVVANSTKSAFESLNAVLTGVKDVREAIDRAVERKNLYAKRTILFVDEVHRWNKAQQDALLPWVENGTFILIGATTENPFFEVNRALVSRSRVFQLKSLDSDALLKTAERALADKERGYGKWRVRFAEGALEHLVATSAGDARSLLNALELSVETSPEQWPPPEDAEVFVSMEAAEESIQRRALLYDKDGDYHFDAISAFIKSVRGSDPDAALYWLAKMARAGEDPAFLFRRMLILAGEDVGLADPYAMCVVSACAQAFERIGFPEGNFPLAHACLYLATAPKSNSSMAFFDALKEVEREDAEVPNHLKDTNRDSESFGHGDGYVYPHAYREHWAAQQYLPTALRGKTFYAPSSIGYEGRIRNEILRKREIQAAVVLGDPRREDILTWSAAAKGREGWLKRLSAGRSALLSRDRDAILEKCAITRHSRTLLPYADDGLLLWESLRRAPEGLTAALARDDAAKDALLRFWENGAADADEMEKPLIAVGSIPSRKEAEKWFNCAEFDFILSHEPFRRGENPARFAEACRPLLAKGGVVVVLASPPSEGGKISRVLADCITVADFGVSPAFLDRLRGAEAEFFQNSGSDLIWTRADMERSFADAGFSFEITEIAQKEERILLPRDLDGWFSEKSRWGAFMADALGADDYALLKKSLSERAKRETVNWEWKSLLVRAVVADYRGRRGFKA
ncbi:MAG: AAA family ATPase [Treponema sp.]|jgi:putative ATPase|nr:AAA family ATPase [Treponema sp.]